MQPFNDFDLRNVLQNQSKALQQIIAKYSNDEIMANDLSILSDNCYENTFIEPVAIYEEDYKKRRIVQKKIRRRADSFWRDINGRDYVEIDGLAMEFTFPYTGDMNLFKCRASTYSLSGYPDIDLSADSFSLHYEFALTEMKTEDDKQKLDQRLSHDVASIKSGIQYANNDVAGFNAGLRGDATDLLAKRKRDIEQFYSVSKMFEIPLQRSSYAETHIPIQRIIKPTNRKYNDTPSYGISNKDYSDILQTIKHNISTYERTPASFRNLNEEDIRNMLLAALNGVYQGNATGETFRRKGKTDICIEYENRSAFVAECKMWKGQSKVEDALNQLDGYLTWRDCKTALIFFVRNKDFISVLTTAKQALSSNPRIRQVREIDRNEIECDFYSQENVGQIVIVRVFLVNLYS